MNNIDILINISLFNRSELCIVVEINNRLWADLSWTLLFDARMGRHRYLPRFSWYVNISIFCAILSHLFSSRRELFTWSLITILFIYFSRSFYLFIFYRWAPGARYVWQDHFPYPEALLWTQPWLCWSGLYAYFDRRMKDIWINLLNLMFI